MIAERRDLRGRLASVIATLAEPYRSVLLLHDFEGFPHAEIAATLSCATGTSRHHLFVARRLVRLGLTDPPSSESHKALRAYVRRKPSSGDDVMRARVYSL